MSKIYISFEEDVANCVVQWQCSTPNLKPKHSCSSDGTEGIGLDIGLDILSTPCF